MITMRSSFITMRSSFVAIVLLALLNSPLLAATCFWVGGTGTWSTTNTTNWASGSGGTAGTCAATGGVPKQSADTATFDGAATGLNGGTVTVDSTMSGVTLASIAAGAMNGTLDFSVNNPSMTLSGTLTIGGGASAATVKLGSGTFTFTSPGNTLIQAASTNLTFNAGTSTIVANANVTSNTRTLALGGLTWNVINIAASNPSGGGNISLLSGTGSVIGTLILASPLSLSIGSSMTITNALNINAGGSSSSVVQLLPSGSNQPTVTLSSAGNVCNWCVVGLKFATNTLSATNSIPNGLKSNLTNVTFTAPGGGGGHIIGG